MNVRHACSVSVRGSLSLPPPKVENQKQSHNKTQDHKTKTRSQQHNISTTITKQRKKMVSVTSMNNNAAQLIEQKEYLSALKILAEALSKVQNEVDSMEDSSSAEDENDQNISVYSFLDAQQVQARRRSNTQCDSTDCSSPPAQQVSQCLRLEEEENAGEDFVYRHPIRVNDTTDESDRNEIYIFSVILVFNLALTHHLMALEETPPTATALKAVGGDQEDPECKDSKDSSSQRRRHFNHLKSALKLYELGFDMQMKGLVSMDMTYTMAMVNNCASICKALNQRQRAQKFYEHLLSSLLYLVENGEADNIDEFDGFLGNASKLILRKKVAAAAA
jgi:hypothetical protein